MTKDQAQSAVNRLTAKALGYMDQGLGHGHYGWVSLSQDEFYELHSALEILGLLDSHTSQGERKS